MILTCPGCSTRYLVPDDSIGPDGRRVRCTKCGEMWHQAGPRPEPADSPPSDSRSADVPPALERQVEVETVVAERVLRPIPPGSGLPVLHQPPRRRSHAWAWAALVVLIAAFAGLAAVERERLVRLWPPLAEAYALIGLPVEAVGEGLSLELSPIRHGGSEGRLVEVAGRIANGSDEARPVPAIRVALLDREQRELTAQVYAPGVSVLAAGATLDFVVAFAEGGPDAAEVSGRFAPRSAVGAGLVRER